MLILVIVLVLVDKKYVFYILVVVLFQTSQLLIDTLVKCLADFHLRANICGHRFCKLALVHILNQSFSCFNKILPVRKAEQLACISWVP